MAKVVALWLTVFDAAGKPCAELRFKQRVIRIGTLPSADVRLDDVFASRMHAVIEAESIEETSIIDIGSTHGTFVDGHRISKAKLRNLSEIRIGTTRIGVAVEREVEI
jgi:pSer/pThr/pTyr-binding forkhead associated (FHA) protein